MLKLLGLSILTVGPMWAQCSAWTNSYTYCRTVTVNHSQVSGTQTSFPVLVSFSDTTLKTVGNGGHIQNTVTCCTNSVTAPADFIFTSDQAGSSLLNWEFETYSATAGTGLVWVNVASINSSSDTVIYLFYGKSAVVTYQATATSAWNSNYVGVWHFPDGSSLSANESTINGNNGTINSVTATTGQIDGGGSFNGTSASVGPMANSSLNLTGNITVEAWVNVSSFAVGVYRVIASKGYDGADEQYIMRIDNTGTSLDFFSYNGNIHGAVWAISGWSTNTWHHVAGTYNGTVWVLYFDGSAVVTATDTGITAASAPVYIGGESITGTPSRFFSGSIDEVHIANTGFASSWILTEFHNQNAPGSFTTLGSESTLSTVVSPLFIPVAGTYGSTQNVAVSTSTGGATIKYTTDGTTPSPAHGSVYASPVTISTTTLLSAMAFKTGFLDSSVNSGTFTITGGGGGGGSSVTGVFKNPDGTGVTGHITASLSKSTVTNSCAGTQVTTLAQVQATITNGTVGTLSLYPNSCLSVAKPTSGTPSAFVGLAAGTGASTFVTCSTVPCNVAGTITLNTGTGPLQGVQNPFTTGSSNLGSSTLLVMTMATVNGNQPVCSLKPSSSNTNTAPIVYKYSIGQTQTSLTVAVNGIALSASTSYTWYYSCVQPYNVYVYDQNNNLLYKTLWSVPNTSPVDVTLLDATTVGYSIGTGN